MTAKKLIKSIYPLGFQWKTADPFLFCAHHEDKYPAGNEQMGPNSSLDGRHLGQDFIIKDGWRMYHGKEVPGFPGHPHRGFETITIVRKGLVDHADSLGQSGRYGNGDVQWMTAGSGVQHSEMFPLLNKYKENPAELFQIWLNLPKKNKMTDPHFKMLWSDEIPVINESDEFGNKTEIEVITGFISGKSAPLPPPSSWAANTKNDVAILNIQMEAGATYKLSKTSAISNRTAYFYEGNNLEIEGEIIPNYHAVEVEADMDLILKNTSNEKIKILILQGKPINEPVVQHGPFVMNTREEIQEAFNDYHETQFGGWPWPKYGQVHDRNLGRFAKHADGRYEDKG
ncbi:MAG: pirin family protein [Crocinitomicaceae bacterium]|nr:pirin family protein [Crocinitomicaceae bacterium]